MAWSWTGCVWAFVGLGLALAVGRAGAQVDVLDSPTTASLRGVSSAGAGVAWVSGANGAIFRSEDGGYLWQTCAVPPGGAHLDYRGVQGFDGDTALVMASGKGALSAVYKTTDGCASWRLVLKNPDAEGFWDALAFDGSHRHGYVWGDPVGGSFVLYETGDGGETWVRSERPQLKVAATGIGGFAASNSSFSVEDMQFGTSGPAGPWVYTLGKGSGAAMKLPMQGAAANAGVFSLGAHGAVRVAVGGDYQKPEEGAGTAAFSTDGGLHWMAAAMPPHGYRSAVAYDPGHKAWLAVGPNGMDVSLDDGRTWRAVAGAEVKGWNAISLPFLVGAKGQIGVVREELFSGR